jgi:plasmid maintenance system antidote protein VapI
MATRTKTDLTAELTRAIEASGLTHYRLGAEAGVAPEVIGRFVARERDIRLATAARLADALGLVLVQPGRRKPKAR